MLIVGRAPSYMLYMHDLIHPLHISSMNRWSYGDQGNLGSNWERDLPKVTELVNGRSEIGAKDPRAYTLKDLGFYGSLSFSQKGY